MVQRYNSSTSVPTAPVAIPRDTGASQITEVIGGIASKVRDQALQKLDEREKTFEVASLNRAQLELEKRGGELALTLQKDRVAGDGYVRDLERERANIKKEIWSTLPSRVQKSDRAMQAWDNIWTSSEISASRNATVWQKGEEEKYAAETLGSMMNAMTARLEANPDGAQSEMTGWKNGLALYKGILTEDQLAGVSKEADYLAVLATVRGLSAQDRYDEAEKVIDKTAKRFDDRQREAFRGAVDGDKQDKRVAKNLAEAEERKGQELNKSQFYVDIWDGKASRAEVEEAARDGRISPNDRPELLSAIRSYQSSLISETAMSAEQRALLQAQSEVAKAELLAMPPELLLTTWAQEDEDRFDGLTLAHKADVLNHVEKMRQGGQTVNAVTAIRNEILAQAQLTMPKKWTLSGQSQSEDEKVFQGILYRLAEEESRKIGGQPLTAARARELSAKAYKEARPKGMKTAALNTGAGYGADLVRDVDPQRFADIKRALHRRTGATPSDAEVMDAYWNVVGGQLRDGVGQIGRRIFGSGGEPE